ncbi:ComF family protein [Ureibacillus endophyticus]|uniref:ComF family protein n=1 Tax=Ureibacillus endophyticus TaxID=1978490 RepID=A0A494YWH0_9BACL|nr:phosphoribosyltransferase family protein [Lysinibacillus endophyticus]RKQ14567.1 ComF family protein [Lysinibacillus endophyticus]
MKRNEVTNCLICNAPLNHQITWKSFLTNAFPKTICTECEQKFVPYENTSKEVISLYQYNDAMKDFLHRYKFMHDVMLAKVFRAQIHEQLSKTHATIVPIPLHPTKLKERSFAQVDELLKAAHIPYEHFLEKTMTDTQVGKTRQERLATPQFFKLIKNCKNKEIILVDDIYTTGVTINHAKNLLLHSGAKSVRAFTLIRG